MLALPLQRSQLPGAAAAASAMVPQNCCRRAPAARQPGSTACGAALAAKTVAGQRPSGWQSKHCLVACSSWHASTLQNG